MRYRSFWAFNTESDRGFNGVATWIRKDLAQHARATQTVLRDEMDREGRCLLVDLGSLAVFNVYAPRLRLTDDGKATEESLQRKVKFLQLLQARIEETRSLGKQVVICGDLNLTYRAVDVNPARLCVKVEEGCILGRRAWPLSEKACRKSPKEGAYLRVAEAIKELQAQVTMTAELARSSVDALKPGPEGPRVPTDLTELPSDLPSLPPDRILTGITLIEGSEAKAQKAALPKLWCWSAAAAEETPAGSLEGTASGKLLPRLC